MRRRMATILSPLVCLALTLQLFVGALFPAPAKAATVGDDKRITFRLSDQDIRLTVKGSFNDWGNDSSVQQTIYATEQDGLVTYEVIIRDLPPNQSFEYKFLINDEWMPGPNRVETSDAEGTLRLAISPQFYVAGSFDDNWNTRHRLIRNGEGYEYTTDVLPDGTYEYKFIAVLDGIGDIYFRDPANPNVALNGNSVVVVGTSPEPSLEPDVFEEQPGGRTAWYIAGSFQGWNNQNELTRMKHLADGFYAFSIVLPAGHHEFKITKNGTWDGFSDQGNNFSMDLTEDTKVNFYVNEKIGEARISVPGVAGLPQYVPSLPEDRWPRLVGTVQPLFGESEWSPEQAKQMFVDYYFNGTVYKIQRTLPAGTHEVKVAFGPNWNESYGGNPNNPNDNLVLTMLDPADVVFSIDYSAGARVLTHNYKPFDGFDGMIQAGKIEFDSRSAKFKKPFGAIAAGTQDVTLRIAAQKDDVQLARVEVIDPEGIGTTFDMRKVTTVGDQDFFEVTIPKWTFRTIGIWGFKFILIDGQAKVEYGDDGLRGGKGIAQDDGAVPFDLTVYDPAFRTPDWMKNAIVYQIFPDRFFDGDKSNNRAKLVDGYRGVRDDSVPGAPIQKQPLQYFDGGVPNDPAPGQVWGNWSDVPENPDRVKPENRPNYPDAKSDGVWTNEFYGGDIKGIEKKLDYLKSLGVTAIYLNPVAWAASNHKYDATDYNHLDPMFGEPVYNVPGDPASGLNYAETKAASDRVFIEFAKAARAKGIRLITDGVFNHVGDDSIYFDRYEKYPEIGAYEFWAKVYDKLNATPGMTLEQAKQAVINEFTSKVNPLTGKNYKYPDDFEFTTWFTIHNKKVKDRDGRTIYQYDAWWGYDSLPAMDAKEPQPGDDQAIEGSHEWNNVSYRNHVIGSNLTGLSDAEAEQAMQFATSQRWIWMGSRGWRLDVAPDVSGETWRKFREAVKSAAGRKDANGETIDDPIILGEIWDNAATYLLGDKFDSVMNYRFRGALQSFLLGGKAEHFHEALESIREDYPTEAWQVMLNLVGSHDTTRNITKLDHPEWEEEHLVIAPEPSDRALKLQALTAIFQMGYPGAPTIYYGDEVGLAGTKDPDSRRTFPWERVTEENGTYAGTGRYAELFDVYRKAADIRNRHEVFRTGDLKVAYAKDGVIAYSRKSAGQAGLVVINREQTPQTIQANVSGFLPNGLTLKDQLYGQVQGTVQDGMLTLTVPAMTGLMMVSEGTFSEVPAVQDLTATAGNGEVRLSWSPVNGADHYNVYRAPIEGGDLELIAGGLTATDYTDTNVVNGTKYYYAVTAQIGIGESPVTGMVSATPFFPVQDVEITAPAADMTIGVGKRTNDILVAIQADGLTDDPTFAGAAAPGLIAKLAYYKDGEDRDKAGENRLRYREDTPDGKKKVYYGFFEPTEPGIYKYFAKVSTDNGETWFESQELTLVANADPADTVPPAAPRLEDIMTESNRATLRWTPSDDAAGYDIYRKAAGETVFTKIATVDKTVTEYVDFTVSNDTTYTYKVAAFDLAYNRAFSEEKSVTPKLVMVDVTLRLHLPDYTPATDDIYIAGTFNGWNAAGNKLTVPSGATDRSVVEFKFKMMAGKTIEYKYTRGSWETEALTSHARIPDDKTDYGNWGYSSTDTNMKLTIQNQGGNRMIVNDYVLRWVDMPMILYMPRFSLGSDIAYSTSEDHFTLKANVPYGVAFTINGKPLPDGAMDAYGNVYAERIPLEPGPNTFVLHIEPTQETLNQPWFTDKGRAKQATKTLTLQINRTSGTPGDGSDPGHAPGGDDGFGGTPGHGGTGSTPHHDDAGADGTAVKIESLPPAVDGMVAVTLAPSVQRVLLSMQAVASAAGNRLVLDNGSMRVEWPQEVLTQLLALVPAEQLQKAILSIRLERLTKEQVEALLPEGRDKAGIDVHVAGQALKIGLSVLTPSGETALTGLDAPLTLVLPVDEGADADVLGVYKMADDGGLAYVGGRLAGGKLSVEIDRFGTFAVLTYHKRFTDLPDSHWAAKAVRILAARHVIRGKTSDRFAPNDAVTRAEFAALIARALGLRASAAAPFRDVARDAWFADAVAAVHEAGIVTGRSADVFDPYATITREEMAVMIVRAYLHVTGREMPQTDGAAYFADRSELHEWSAAYVDAAYSLGLVRGKPDRRFAPGDVSTRAESAQVILNLLLSSAD